MFRNVNAEKKIDFLTEIGRLVYEEFSSKFCVVKYFNCAVEILWFCRNIMRARARVCVFEMSLWCYRNIMLGVE